MRFVSSQLLPSSFLWHLNPFLLSFRLAISSDLFVFTYSLTGHLTGRNVHRGRSYYYYYYYYYSLLRQRQHITDMKSNTIRSTSWIWKRLVKFQCSFNVISQQYLCNATDMIQGLKLVKTVLYDNFRSLKCMPLWTVIRKGAKICVTVLRRARLYAKKSSVYQQTRDVICHLILRPVNGCLWSWAWNPDSMSWGWTDDGTWWSQSSQLQSC